MQQFLINSLIYLAMVVIVCCAQDYYTILDLKKNCKDRDIKKAFRKLAMKYHPDKNKEEGAEEKFMEIAQAYEVLADEDKRKEYDMMGHAAYTQKQTGGNGGRHSGSGFRNFNFDDIFANFDDIFKNDGFFANDGFFGNHDHHEDDIDIDDIFGAGGFGGGFPHEFGDFEHFGSQDSFFAGFQQQNDHMNRHGEAHRRAHNLHNRQGQGAHFQNIHNINRRGAAFGGGSGGRSCRTVTQRVGNMVTTYTTCS